MKEKAKTKNNRNRKRSPMSKLFARTSAMPTVTRERDWQTDVPNIKLSRAFVVVLIIHVVALGGILAFEMFKPKPVGEAVAMHPASKETQLEKQSRERSSVPANAPRERTHTSHIVQSGDSLIVIADRYGLTSEDITKSNLIDDGHPLSIGRVLKIPKEGRKPREAVVSTEKPTTLSRPPAAVPASEYVPPAIPATPSVAGTLPKDDGDDFASLDDLLSNLGGTPEELSPETSGFETIPAPAPILEKAEDKSDDFASWKKAPEIVKPRALDVPPAPRTSNRATVVRSVPAEKTMEKKAPSATKTPTASARSHKVSAGETFYAISRKYGVSVNALKSANSGVDPSRLQIGQTLRIPR